MGASKPVGYVGSQPRRADQRFGAMVWRMRGQVRVLGSGLGLVIQRGGKRMVKEA